MIKRLYRNSRNFLALFLAIIVIGAPIALAKPFSTGQIELIRGRSHKSSGGVSVKGYSRKNGTFVRPHHRSRANETKADNWSTKGNVNPYIGEPGTKDVDR